jgi:hypothetical protein
MHTTGEIGDNAPKFFMAGCLRTNDFPDDSLGNGSNKASADSSQELSIAKIIVLTTS